MTTICAITDGKKITFGGDSQATTGFTKTLRRTPKVFRKGDFLFGWAGSFRMADILQHSFQPPKHDLDIEADEYIRTGFINTLRSCFVEYGFGRNKEGENFGGSFLLGYQGRIFSIADDYQVGEDFCSYSALGSGTAFVLGALYAISEDKSLSHEQKLEIALKASATFDIATSAPFHFVEMES